MNIATLLQEANKTVDDIESNWKFVIKTCNKVIEQQPNNTEALNLRHKLFNTFFPEWHVAMINDEVRNRKYFEAFERIDWKDKTVLEIGTGSGLLAMLMVKAGAEHVYTCEATEFLAHAARKIVTQNGLTDRITVISELSTNITVPEHLPKRADILVTETFASDLLNESAIASIKDAHSRLITETPKVLPRSGSLVGNLFSSSDIRNSMQVSAYQGLNLSEFDKFTKYKHFQLCNTYNFQHEALSNTNTILTSNFETAETSKLSEISFDVTSPGTCDGLMYWLEIQVDQHASFSSAPNLNPEDTTHWRQCIYLFEQQLEVSEGEKILLSVTLSDDFIRFSPNY